VRLERLGKLKKSTSWGFHPATFWLVAWCLNQLRYRMPPCINVICVYMCTHTEAYGQRGRVYEEGGDLTIRTQPIGERAYFLIGRKKFKLNRWLFNEMEWGLWPYMRTILQAPYSWLIYHVMFASGFAELEILMYLNCTQRMRLNLKSCYAKCTVNLPGSVCLNL
jgi:hypothetical protein